MIVKVGRIQERRDASLTESSYLAIEEKEEQEEEECENSCQRARDSRCLCESSTATVRQEEQEGKEGRSQ